MDINGKIMDDVKGNVGNEIRDKIRRSSEGENKECDGRKINGSEG